MDDLLVTPKSVIEVIIPTPPDNYSGYLYKFTDTITGKMYIGVHKGTSTDSYWHSSTSKEFQKICSGNKPRLKYEILEYGDYKVMTVREHNILKAAKAKDNDEYFNKTNGSPQFQTIDYDKIEQLVTRINMGEFANGNKPISDIIELEKYQVRTEEDKSLINYIAQSVDDNLGNTSNCNPVTIFEGQGTDRADIIGNGSHTTKGVHKSKHGQDVSTNYIPFEETMGFTESELQAVCNLLNKSDLVKKKAVNKDDAVKYLVNCWMDGIPLTDPGHEKYLNKLGFTNYMLASIMRDAENEIELRNAKDDEVFRTYDSKELDNIVEEYRNPNTLSWYTASSLFRFPTLMDKIWATLEIDADGEPVLSEKKHIVSVVHHTCPSDRNNWNKRPKGKPYEMTKAEKVERYMEFFFGGLGYTYETIVLPSTIKSSIGGKK